jgi:hypothetical protein
MEVVLTKLAVILQVCVQVSKPSGHNVVKMKGCGGAVKLPGDITVPNKQ